MNYQPVIGLEIHVELNTKSKMFCSCLNNSDEKRPNVNICPICTAQPGTLPVINSEAVKKVLKTGLALNCRIPEDSKFDRKNYFYPDLPKGYQISQYDMPLCKEGFLNIAGKKIKIRRVHLEEDTGRLLHPVGVQYSLVDFNRAGVPLMELVTEPDISSAKEARDFSQELQLILRYLGVSDADMEKGQMRVEANISLQKTENRKWKTENLGTKVEIKNLNSFKAVEKAVEYEIERQKQSLESGKKIIQETRGWNDAKGETFSQREKEEAHDYRYFPEPDLPPLKFPAKEIDKIRAEIPELPQQKRERFDKEYGLGPKTIEVFISNKDLSEYYEKVMSELRNWIKEAELKEKIGEEEFLKLAKTSANYLITDVQGLLKNTPFVEADFSITPENYAELVTLIYEDKISSKGAKMVLEEMFKTGADPSHLIGEKGLAQTTNEEEIRGLAREVVLQNLKAVEDYKKGKESSLQFLVGQLMAKSRGKANPQLANKLIKEVLTEKK